MKRKLWCLILNEPARVFVLAAILAARLTRDDASRLEPSHNLTNVKARPPTSSRFLSVDDRISRSFLHRVDLIVGFSTDVPVCCSSDCG